MIIGNCLFCKKEFRKRETKYKFCSLSCSNRCNLNGLNKVELPSFTEELAEFVGICLGDGYTSKYQVGVTLNSIVDKMYAPYLINLIKNLFPGANSSYILSKRQNTIDIRINSVTVADFMRGMGIVSNAKYIPRWVLTNSNYIKSCIRGLFDTEGSISFKIYKSRIGFRVYKQLNFRNFNIHLMRFVRDNLVVFGFKPTMSLKGSLYLSNHEDIDKFRELIGFSNPKLLRKSLVYDINALNAVGTGFEPV